MYSFSLDKLPGHKIYKQPRIKLLKKINESVLSHITFYLEFDDHKPVIFIGETISFTCQLIKIYKKMNLKMIIPKNETEDYLRSITKNCGTLLKQTDTRPQETLEFELTKLGKTFSFKPPISLGIDSNGMVGLPR